MPKIPTAYVTCYCGIPHLVTQDCPVKCTCGITLHIQAKKHGQGKVWGTVPVKRRDLQQKVISMIRSGESRLDSRWVE